MLPIEFKERMRKLLGDEAEALLRELEEGENQRAFRVNGLKISTKDFQAVNKLDAEPIPHVPDGFYTGEEKPGNTAAHHSGMIYMQDPGAMATVCALNVKRGDRVLDCCAAPGGKSSQLAALVGEEGIVVSNEYVSKRAAILQGNLERMGCRSSVVLNLDAKELPRTYREYFDVVVCDAPCSGEGMFRKNPLAISEWSVENVKMCAERQKEIIDEVQKCVAVGGVLLYSTCTFSLEENEMLVEDFLREHREFELIDVADSIKAVTADGICFDGAEQDMSKTRRFYPHVSRGEGQFIALMKKTASTLARSSDDSPSRRDRRDGKQISKGSNAQSEREMLRVASEFLSTHLNALPQKELTVRAGTVRLSTDCPTPEHGVLMNGVCVGEVVKSRLVPHHQLFSAYGADFKNKVCLAGDDPRVAEYIKGMEISTPDTPDGYAALIVDGCALGGVKVSGGRAKNHYPKGLRGEIQQ